ncbi:MAG TPA: hypothetical protein GXZ60_03740 [Intrasporangiaceae bacterium]|nr:hypothetical protein [Intrasporangiaceae bacterium]
MTEASTVGPDLGRPQDHIPQPITAAAFDEVARSGRPGLSLLVPTARSGPETQAARTHLRALLSIAEERLAGDERADEMLAPARALADDSRFWQHQDRGLALYTVPGRWWMFSTRDPLGPEVALDFPRLRPLVRYLPGPQPFAVLALSRNKVRLLVRDGAGLSEVDLGPVPASEADIHEDRDHQVHLQYSAQGGGDVNFHGHGAGGEVDRVKLERFLRAVVRGLEQHPALQDPTLPVLVAAVRPTRSMLAQVWRHAGLLDDGLDGNHDRTAAHDLYDQALTLVRELRENPAEEAEARFARSHGTGLATTGLESMRRAAADGRVETLLVQAPGEAAGHGARFVADPVDELIVDSLRTGGQVLPVGDGIEAPEGCAALLRW